ncbi:MAG: FlgD immunoglobulin-like domain containing protein [bacterium]
MKKSLIVSLIAFVSLFDPAFGGGLAILVNEIALKGGGGYDHDWVEFLCADDGRNGGGILLDGYAIASDGEFSPESFAPNPVKNLDGIFIKTGEYLLLHFDSSKPDERSSTKGSINIYTPEPYLTSTDEQIVLYEASSGRILDAAAWANRNGEFSPGEEEDVEGLASSGAWEGTREEDCFDSSTVGDGVTFGRLNDVDTNTKGDFSLLNVATPGRDNTPGKPPVILRINEVAFNGGGGPFHEDWVEVYCVNDGAGGAGYDIRGFHFQDDSVIKVIGEGTDGPVMIKTGEYLILHFDRDSAYPSKRDEPDTHHSEFENVIQIYTSKSGLTATDEQIILRDVNGLILDAVAWSDGELSSEEAEDLQELVEAGEWTFSSAGDCVDSTKVPQGYSIARISAGADTNSRSDWRVEGFPTPGAKNFGGGAKEAVRIRSFNVSPKVFVVGGGRVATVSVEIDRPARIFVAVYDVKGRLARRVVDTGGEKLAGAYEFLWDGRDDRGRTVPVGAYVIFVEARSAGGISNRSAALFVAK